MNDLIVYMSVHTIHARHMQNIEYVMLVGLATQSNKKHTNKCADGLTHYRIKVT